MEVNQILSYIASYLIGITLGIFGGGGTILTLPVLAYLLYYENDIAIHYSMFIVGATTFVGGINSYIKKFVNLKAAYSFGIPSLIAVYLTSKTLMPWIKSNSWTIGSYVLSGKHFLMFLFAIMMIIVALFMIFKKQNEVIEDTNKKKKFYFGIIIKAALVGVLSGLIGAGGGFIIVPSLMAFYKLNIKEAIGTSLVIIAANSIVGFLGSINSYQNDWWFLISFSLVSILGIVSGLWLSRRIQASRLKIAFGYFVLLMGIYVFLKEVFLKA